MRLLLFFLSFLTLWPPVCGAPVGGVRHYCVADGLSLNTVMAITQDSDGFIWIGTKNGLNRFDGYHFDIFTRDGSTNSLCNSMINALAEDSDGLLWIGTDKGVCYLDRRDGQFHAIDYRTPFGLLSESCVNQIAVDGQRVYLVTGVGVYYYDKTSRQTHNLCGESGIDISTQAKSIYIDSRYVYVGLLQNGIVRIDKKTFSHAALGDKGLTVTCIEEYDSGHLIVGTAYNGICLMDKGTGACEHFARQSLRNLPYMRDIRRFANGQIWAATENGVYVFRPDGSLKEHLSHRDFHPETPLSDNAVYAIFADKDGGIWMGSYFGGVDYMPPSGFHFRLYQPVPQAGWLSGHRIRGFAEDSDGMVWIATEDEGLGRWNPLTDEFMAVGHGQDRTISHTNIQCLRFYNGELWIGTYTKGIDVYNPHTGNLRHYGKEKPGTGLGIDDIFAIYADRNGRLWVGTPLGLYLYDPRSDRFGIIKQLAGCFVSDIIESPDGQLWLATYNRGLVEYDTERGTAKYYAHGQADSCRIQSDRITCLQFDGDGRLWVGTEDGGISVRDPNTGHFCAIMQQDGLPTNVVYAMVRQEGGSVWVSTNRGLAEIDPKSLAVIGVYGKESGIGELQFNYNAAISLRSGDMCFGSINGFVRFSPAQSSRKVGVSRPRITNLFINNAGSDEATSAYSRFAEMRKKGRIVLKHNENDITLRFSCLNYYNMAEGHYEYRLDGVDDHWNMAGDNPEATYSNLKGGDYTFRVRYASHHGSDDMSETRIGIEVKPPLFLSYPALIVYAAILAGLAWWTVRGIRLRRRRREESRRRKELYKAKLKFVTNVSHEIQSPLTLIDVPLKYLLGNNLEPDKARRHLEMMRRNVDRLLNLSRQLLDFKKITNPEAAVKFQSVDVATLVRDICGDYAQAAELSHKDLRINITEEPVVAAVDTEAITRLVSNLLDNALKHAANHVDLSFAIDADGLQMSLRVSNDGDTIPAEYADRVFDLFFRVPSGQMAGTQGFGIGLSMCRDIAAVHGGRIYVDGQATDTTFCVELPIRTLSEADSAALPMDIVASRDLQIPTDATSASADESRTNPMPQGQMPTILIVDDDKDMLALLCEQLSSYNVLTATNGREAIGILQERLVDLVITDLIMPHMDGISLTDSIKSDEATSHIPVVILTARNGDENKIEGLSHQADAYIEKPFAPQLLLTQISNILRRREQMRQYYAHNIVAQISVLGGSKSDQQFLDRLTKYVRQHIADSEFSVDSLAVAMNMSPSSLRRKIKSLTGGTPGQIVRVIRLKRAAELMADSNRLISDIAFMVGFSSASHFTKAFHEQFGINPAEFQRSASHMQRDK